MGSDCPNVSSRLKRLFTSCCLLLFNVLLSSFIIEMDDLWLDTVITGVAVCAAAVASLVQMAPEEKSKRKRRFRVQPYNRNRHKEGHFYTSFNSMRTLDRDTEQYFKHTRMSPDMFTTLLNLVRPHLQKDPKKYSLSPEHRLLITIHYLSEGCSMQDMAKSYRVGKATVHVILKETLTVLWEVLSVTEMPVPTLDDWENIEREFADRWQMPNCIGALDGKHCLIQNTQYSGTEFVSYKKNFSIVLMALCDAKYRFIFVDVGAYGSSLDSTVFKQSIFGNMLLNDDLNVPPPKRLPGSDVDTEHYIVADQAFPLHKRIMRPYPGTCLGETRNVFNYRLSRARRTIENAFGLLEQRWRVLRKPNVARLEMCENIVKATTVLHNFIQRREDGMAPSARRYCPPGYVDSEDADGTVRPGLWRNNSTKLRSVARVGSNNSTRSVQCMRDRLADYLNSDIGSVPWQVRHANRLS